MNKKTKFLLIALCAVFLVAASVIGTLAYFTDDEQAVNTFTVGKVDIVLDEAKVDEYGNVIENADRVTENSYKMIPGHEYVKDPTVTVKAGSEESYVRMLVTLNKMDEIKTALGNDFLPQNYVTGWDSTEWPCVSVKDNGDNTATYEFRYYKIVDDSDELDPLFETIIFPGKLTGEQIANLGDFNIKVVAHAIQADGFSTADEAWDAFDAQVNN